MTRPSFIKQLPCKINCLFLIFCRVGQGYYYPLPPSEPSVQVSKHSAQASPKATKLVALLPSISEREFVGGNTDAIPEDWSICYFLLSSWGLYGEYGFPHD